MKIVLFEKNMTKIESSVKKALSVIFFMFLSSQTLIFLADYAKAYTIEVDVAKVLQAEVTSFSYDASNNLVNFKIEVHNRGSIAYKARTRIDISNISDSEIENTKSESVFTAWSPEKVLMPGDKKTFDLYWYTDDMAEFVARVRVYYGNEILERFFEVEKDSTFTHSTKEGFFEATNLRVYENFVIFNLKANIDAESIYIIPDGFTNGWIFEQKNVESFKEGTVNTIVIPYKPTVFSDDNVTISIISTDPKIYSENIFILEKNRGLSGFVISIIDSFRLLLRQYD